MFLTIGPFTHVESPLQLLDLVSRKALLSPAPEETVQSREQVVGVLSGIEKTIWTACNLVREEYTRQTDVLKSGGKIDGLIHQRLALFKSWHSVFNDLFWVTLNTRFAGQLADPECAGLGIRDGYQVVVMMRKPFDAMAFFADALTTVLEAQGVHDCANCAEYHACDLPIKKPRDESVAEKPDPSKMN